MTLQTNLPVKTDVSMLPMEKQTEIMQIKDSIKFDHESISTYSQGVTKKLTDFSSKILETVKVKDSPEVEDLLGKLMDELSVLDSETMIERKPSLLQRVFKQNNLKTFVLKYESVATVISDVKNKLEQAQYQLRKDIKVTETYLDNNKEYIDELDNYILAGKLRIQDEEDSIAAMKVSLDNDDMLQVQELVMREAEIDGFKRKIHTMELQRVIAIQNIPQLLLLKQGDAVLVEKIDDSINSAIPLWESQMVIAINAMRQQAGVKLQKSISDTTNKLLIQNSEALKQSGIGVATELERDIVDIETLKKSNENLIATLREIKSIRENGAKNREHTAQELKALQMQLNQVLIESSN